MSMSDQWQREGGRDRHLRRFDRQSYCQQPAHLHRARQCDGGGEEGHGAGWALGHYGIVVKGGDENLIEIGKKGAVTSKSHLAIFGGDQDETVRNYGAGRRRRGS